MSISAYLSWVSGDTTRNHKFINQVTAYINKMNGDPSRKRIRDASEIRNAQVLKAKEQRGRRVSGNWNQCVPVSLWSEVFGEEPVPPESQQGGYARSCKGEEAHARGVTPRTRSYSMLLIDTTVLQLCSTILAEKPMNHHPPCERSAKLRERVRTMWCCIGDAESISATCTDVSYVFLSYGKLSVTSVTYR